MLTGQPAMAPPTLAVPPASVPLRFLAAAGLGLTSFGVALALAADRVVTAPTHAGVTSAVHVGVLAFATMAVAGAMHQFAPVVGRRPLRSIAAARLTFAGLLSTAWLLPTGFAHGPENLIPMAGIIGMASVALMAWNLSGPLGRQASSVPVWGLRLSVAFLVITVSFGVVYAINRQTGWFPLLPRRLLAHVHLGLLGWLGLTYVAVAEKLWPMFLLAHRPSTRSGAVAVAGFAAGTALLAPGLLFGARAVAMAGGVIVAVGVAAHVTSLVGVIRHRRRALELLHVAMLLSATFLVAAAALGAMAGLTDVRPAVRSRMVTGEVTAILGWLTIAIVGHVHKIVPFIAYQVLRARGIDRAPNGRPLLFGHLFQPALARVAVAAVATGFAVALAGVVTTTPQAVLAAGALISLGGATTTFNLATGPRRVLRADPAKEQP